MKTKEQVLVYLRNRENSLLKEIRAESAALAIPSAGFSMGDNYYPPTDSDHHRWKLDNLWDERDLVIAAIELIEPANA